MKLSTTMECLLTSKTLVNEKVDKSIIDAIKELEDSEESLNQELERIKQMVLDLAKPLEGKPEPKILKTQDGKGMYGVVTVPENHFVGFGEGIQRAADLAAHIHEPTRIVQLLEPEEDSDAISTALGTVPHDWGIMSMDYEGWMIWFDKDKVWRYSLTSSPLMRFPTKSDADGYIVNEELSDCQPWPIPKLEER